MTRRDPSAMTAAERLRELAKILAVAHGRVVARHVDKAPNPLDSPSPPTAPCEPVVDKEGRAA